MCCLARQRRPFRREGESHEGAYAGLPDVDLWPKSRDARLYAGPWPVVAHAPCERWCKLAHAVQGRYPHLRVGDDEG